MIATSLVGHLLELTSSVDKSRNPADYIASSFFREKHYLGARDRRFISENLFGMIRHRRFIEALLEEHIRLHPEDSHLDAPRVRYLPLFVAYAVCVDSQSVADSGDRTGGGIDHDFSDPSGNEDHRNSIAGIDSLWITYFPRSDLSSFVHSLRALQHLDFIQPDRRNTEETLQPHHERDIDVDLLRLAVKYSFQDWMVQDWNNQLGPETERLLESLNTPARVTLRVNLAKTTREDCRLRLLSEGIETDPTLVSPAGLTAHKRFNAQASETFKAGWFELQDEGSQLLSLICEPRPGSVVIDGCAGAGGKSLHLADLLKGEGEIIAIDVDPSRLRELESRTRRAGVTIIKPILRGRVEQGQLSGDIVLVDAPCTGVGTIRRNPALKWRVSEASVHQHADYQRRLLDFYHRCVKPGGELVYTTCSLLKEENEEVVGPFLSFHPEFRLRRIEAGVCPPSMITAEGFLRVLPYHADTDGFFAARMMREDFASRRSIS